MIPTNYSSYTRGSFWRTVILTTVCTLFLHAFLNAQDTCTVKTGSLTSEICIQNAQVTLRATSRGDTVVPAGYKVLYVLTRGDSLIIEAVSTNASFKIDELEGVYAIHTLVYDSTTLDLGDIVFGQTNAYELFRTLVPGGGSICAGLDTAGVRFRFGNCPISNECEADAGSLAAVEGACFQDSTATLTATIQDSTVVPDGFSRLYVLTSGDGLVIEQVNNQPTFTVDTIGTYRIHTLVYDSTTLNLNTIVFGQTQAGYVDSLLIQGGGTICGALDVTGALFEIEACQSEGCNVNAGSITANGSDSTLMICLSDGEADNIQFSNTNAVLDSGTYAYVVTDTANLIVKVIQGNSENLDGLDSTKVYRIWGIVYSTDSLSLMAGDTLNLTTPVDSCSDVSDNYITVVNSCSTTEPVCEAATGRLSGSPIGCLQPGDTLLLSATVQTQPTVPAGYQVRYVLTSGSDLNIEQISAMPSFEVDTTGTYRIHVLVYDSTTLHVDSLMTAGDVFAMLLDGGGEICGALDTAGVRFNVITCPSGDSCAVSFGSLVAQNENVCLSPDSTQVTLAANIQDAPIVLDSFQVTYLLSNGDSLNILDISDAPSFTVDSVGRYTIHTLVYDSTTLSLDSLTTIANLDSMLIQGGGDICAALDVEGLAFNVEACSSDSCEFNLGGLAIADASDDCLDNGSATLVANVTTQPDVPSGYQVTYLLVYGPDSSRVIQQTNDEPNFTVDTTGNFHILTFVYDSTTFNLDSIVLGQTTSNQLNTLFTQGGGDICAGLSVDGLAFNIQACSNDSCQFDLGVLAIADESDNCLENDSATLIATVTTQPQVPSGYEVRYLLAYGLGANRVIQQINTQPTFTVDTTGRFRMLTFVYDTTSFDLDSIVLGQTTSADLNAQLTQGGGDICAGLSVDGLIFNIEECDQANCDNGIDVGDLSRDTASVDCIGTLNPSGQLIGIIENQPSGPSGYQVTYLLAHGLGRNRVIEQINDQPTFTIDTAGRYRILTLVYDPNTFNPDSIVLGQTSPFTIDSLFLQGGGSICAGFDANGLVFTIEACNNPDSCSFDLGDLARDTASVDCIGDGDEGMLKATVVNEPVVPNGYQVRYLLAHGLGRNRVIEQINETPSFSIDEPGRYRILTLVYDPATLDLNSIELGVTTPYDLDDRLVQGGGSICAGLDVNGLVYTIEACQGGGGNGECDSTDVGKLMIIGNDVRCFEGDSINVKLQFTHAPTVPSGYETAILVTLGDNMQVAEILDGLSFTADSVALYRFQVLVYDPQTFDLSSINLGSTTAADINAQLVQGGGSICAALDTNGIVLDVRDCNVDVNCQTDVKTGSLYAEADGACLDQDYQATLTAQVDVPPMVPAGYQVKYLLTSGNDKVIRALDDEPTFTVDQVDQFRIHVLVYDPATLDLDNINLDVTTIDSLNAMLLQGGGDICAALDVSGLRFYTRDCSCGADAGHLYYTRAGGRSLCLSESGLAFLAGNTQTRPVVPFGFNRVYLLTSGEGMVIEKIANIPVFGVRETGVYRLHTLIYDPNTLDLNSIQLGVTRATEIMQLLRQSGGDICAALEFPGLKFTVKDCSTEGGAPGIVAFPNPATNQVSINLPQQRAVQQVTIEMVDINGNIAKRWQMDGVNTNVNLDINDLQPGMYYIRVLYDQEFVKEMSLVKVR